MLLQRASDGPERRTVTGQGVPLWLREEGHTTPAAERREGSSIRELELSATPREACHLRFEHWPQKHC